MSEFETIIDFGSKNLRLGIFDPASKNTYSSSQKINDNIETSLNILIKDAEKYLSKHIDNIIVLYDSPKFYALDICIRKRFDQSVSFKKVYDGLIEEAQFFVSQNNFKDQIIHSVINNIVVDETNKLDKITQDFNINSLILEIKFICLNKNLVDEISDKFKKNNIKISNLYCSSYVKSVFYKKKFNNKDYIIFIDIGFERSSGFLFNDIKLDYFKSIALGSNNITKDISKVLKLSLDYSEDLKIKFNKEEKDNFLEKNDTNNINPLKEILKKNISIDLFKQIVEARIDEIMELVVFHSGYIKNLNTLKKPKLIMTGGGSQLFSNSNNMGIKNIISELIILDELGSNIYDIGISYHQSDESFLSKIKKRTKKTGFFETFFNLFSK